MSKRILYIEDNLSNRMLVRRLLEASGFEMLEAEDGINGIKIAQAELPDLILMDINIPGMDGYEATTRLKNIEQTQAIPIVAVTANVMKGDREKSLIAGCDGYIQKPIDPESFTDQVLSFLGGKREIVEEKKESRYLKEYSKKLVEKLEVKVIELEEKNKQILNTQRRMEEIYVGIISSLTNAMEARHTYTAGHTQRVTEYCLMIGKELGLSGEDIKTLRRAARLHDIGKLAVDLSTIDKPGELEDEEWVVMKRHSAVGADILKPLKFLQRELELIRDHHERLDGSGYPMGKKGDQISLLTSILSASDVFDALTTPRPYHDPMSKEDAAQYLSEMKGKHFIPEVVEAFIRALARRNYIRDKSA